MNEWLTRAREIVAQTSGADVDLLDLSAADQETLLRLAGFAAHEGGERTNAPLLCYLVGLACGKTGADLSALVAAVTVN
ncbi:MAG: DUF6457 domain-containing protein [Solirubrobacteraceae bacterium]